MDYCFNNEELFACDLSDELEEPFDCKVTLLNDDYTTKEFVVEVLEKIFHKSELDAVAIMESVHKTGSGVVGVYPYDIATTRVVLVTRNARANGYPLRCTMEKV